MFSYTRHARAHIPRCTQYYTQRTHAYEKSLRFRSTRCAQTQAYSRPCYRCQNAGVEHALLEQLMLFSNASIVLEDVDTHRSNFRHQAPLHDTIRPHPACRFPCTWVNRNVWHVSRMSRTRNFFPINGPGMGRFKLFDLVDYS